MNDYNLSQVSILLTLLFVFVCGDRVIAAQEMEEPGVEEKTFVAVEVDHESEQRTLQGEVIVEAADGGMLLLTPDQRLWMLQPDELKSRKLLAEAIEKLDQKELEEQLKTELPDGFNFERGKHFLIAYKTDRRFAQWIRNLYEKLYDNFFAHWRRKRDWTLSEPGYPLVVVVFGTYDEFADHVRNELGQEPGNMMAYYHLLTNRVVLYDLTTRFNSPGQNFRDIPAILKSPGAREMVATIIHEGTHQLMFNMGMQARFADTPLWLNEGLAMYFETPDPNSPQGFSAIGLVNYDRLRHAMNSASRREAKWIETLLVDDNLLRDPTTAVDRYSEAWALTSYLMANRQKELTAYLKAIAEKPVMIDDSAEARISEFKMFFGDNLAVIQAEVESYVSQLAAVR